MGTAGFWKAAFERAVKTFAQALAALLVASGTDILNTSWGEALSVAGMAALLSLLTSIGSSATGDNPGPSLADAEVLEPETLAGKSFESSHKRPEGGAVNWLLIIGVAVVVIAVVLLFSVIDVNKDKDNDGKKGLDWERTTSAMVLR